MQLRESVESGAGQHADRVRNILGHMIVSEGVMQEYDYMNEYWEATHRKDENMRLGHPNIWLRTTEIYRGNVC